MPIDTPRLGAIAVVIRQSNVLLVQRRKAPDAGFWGFPGGHVEFGETALDAAVRELREETSVTATSIEYLTNVDVLRRSASGQVTAHYLLAAVLCDYQSGTPVAADDARDAAWVPVEHVRRGDLMMSDRVIPVMEMALKRDQFRRAALRA